MKFIYSIILLVFALFAVQAQPPLDKDVGDKEKPVLCEKSTQTSVFGVTVYEVTATEALPCKFCFCWNDGRLCSIERLSETVNTNTAVVRESKRPRDWLSKV